MTEIFIGFKTRHQTKNLNFNQNIDEIPMERKEKEREKKEVCL